MRKKRFTIPVLILAVVLSALLTAGGIFAGAWAVLGREGLSMLEAVAIIRASFVGDYDMGSAANQGLDALITGLGDRWSYYMDAEGYAEQQESRSNAYVGIGVTVTYPEEGGLLIQSVVEGGPADQAGLKPGERITAVDGAALTAEGGVDGSERIRGAEGTQVVLTVLGTDGTQRQVTVTRRQVEEHPVSFELLEDGTGLVTIKNFNSRCAEESIEAVDTLVEEGAERLIFDVRNNGGGYLNELTELLDHLLPEGTIFRSESKSGWKGSVQSDAECIELPMAVLVNGNTYSAAELFAAELQEMDWAVVVGEPTFGKGFSQQTFPLLNGGAINISTAKYFTGEGVSLIGTGLTLDREVSLTEEEGAALAAGALPPAEDPQLQAALTLLEEE